MMLLVNSKGTVVSEADGIWIIEGYRNRKYTIKWSEIPPYWRDFWKDVTMSLVKKNQIASALQVTVAARLLHQWHPTEFYSFDELSEEDFVMFNKWMSSRPKHSKLNKPIAGTVISSSYRRSIFVGLNRTFMEAITLRRQEVTERSLETLEEARRNQFINHERKLLLELLDRALTDNETNRIYEVMLSQIHLARQFIDKTSDFDGVKSPGVVRDPTRVRSTIKRAIDMLAVISIWLSLEHGIRPEELLSLTLDDIHEDSSGQGLHSIYCHAPNKNPRNVIINNLTAANIELFVKWTKAAREALHTNAFCVDWTAIQTEPNPHIYNSTLLGSRLKRFSHNHNLCRDDGTPLQLSLKLLRRSFGAQIAATTQNREYTRLIMGHEQAHTTDTYYISQAASQLSKNVYDALRPQALRLASAYRQPLYDIEESPELLAMLQSEPERNINLGVCTVPRTTYSLKDSCQRPTTCLECPFLVVEERKQDALILERDTYIQLASQVNDDRVRQQRLRHAAMAQAYIELIDQKSDLNKTLFPQRRRKRSYANGSRALNDN